MKISSIPKVNPIPKVDLTPIEEIDFEIVRKDVERFLEDKNELKLLDKDILIGMIDK